MARATYKGKCRDKNGYAVHLFYEYRGREYMITDEHNGYSETIAEKHKREQDKIDEMLDGPETYYTEENHPEATGEAENAIEALISYFETGDETLWETEAQA